MTDTSTSVIKSLPAYTSSRQKKARSARIQSPESEVMSQQSTDNSSESMESAIKKLSGFLPFFPSSRQKKDSGAKRQDIKS
jgi:hypothetical protein